ncbi:non-ribosomal peptide synthetase [Aneurinibacillus aneurinilyticus]|uniref:Amino acid adenylation domain-containing protein n=1 Tax=Aneurinibacillus aneurinilyticus TaxID=1391 RepID=A0A848CWT9_ANEAE|nr:non-ribosomal peptide synthetase [Aneurinibacillus aneurinilyticus]NME98919.1 amino acid adenylation domain-containing protein [Aneurinibacillus aneurinilyticus]
MAQHMSQKADSNCTDNRSENVNHCFVHPQEAVGEIIIEQPDSSYLIAEGFETERFRRMVYGAFFVFASKCTDASSVAIWDNDQQSFRYASNDIDHTLTVDRFINQNIYGYEKYPWDKEEAAVPLYRFSYNETRYMETSEGGDGSHSPEPFNLDIQLINSGEYIRLQIRYSIEKFTDVFARSLGERYLLLLRQMLASPSRYISELSIVTEEEQQQLLHQTNQTHVDYPLNQAIHYEFERQAEQRPYEVAVSDEHGVFTYHQLEQKSNQLAHYLLTERRVRSNELIGICMERSIYMMVAVLGILKSGAAYVPLDPNDSEHRLANIVQDAGIRTLLTSPRHLDKAERLLWATQEVEICLCLTESHQAVEISPILSGLMDKQLWDFVSTKAGNEIEAGGWVSSYSGEPFSEEEMAEYADNVLAKLRPYLHANCRVLEIGCASGLTMYKIAPHVGLYYGTDLSNSAIVSNRERIEREGISHIKLHTIAAHEIDQLSETSFDIVIMNSIVQLFPNHRYLMNVLQKAVGLCADNGILFVGDVMALEAKEQLEESLLRYKVKHPHARTKTNWSNELFLPKLFWEELCGEIPAVQEANCSEKNGTYMNELTLFRYDVLMKINHTGTLSSQRKRKHVRDARILEHYGTERPKVDVSPDDLAYCLYTSGSTGTPKGVLISHRSIRNRLLWMQRAYPLGPQDVILQKTAITFDVSVWELLWWTFSGARLHFLRPEGEKDPKVIWQTVVKQQVTVMHFVPGMLTTFLEHVRQQEAASFLQSLRYVFSSGESLHIRQAESFRSLLYETYQTRLINVYGPTEATVDVSCYDCFVEGLRDPIPIGKPIDNIRLYVLDSDLRLVPDGMAGELFIAGEGVAKGYLNRPELTAERFLPHPYIPGETIYRTGDKVCRLYDGHIEYLGRIDHQIKWRGYRIEPGEIESRLKQVPGILETAVQLCGSKQGSEALCAYYTANAPLEEGVIRKFLENRLAHYMIPSHFIALPNMPRTSSGKIDRKKLVDKWTHETFGKGERIVPADETEKRMFEIWREVCGWEHISPTANFYMLGGHSLQALHLLSAVNDHFGVLLSLADFFSNPSIRGVVEIIKRQLLTEDGYRLPTIYPDTENHYESFPLNDLQQAYYVGRRSDFDIGSISTHVYVELECADYDHVRLLTAINRLIERHDALRCVMTEDGMQRILPKLENFDVPLEDIRILDAQSREDFLQQKRSRLSRRLFLPDRVPLFDVHATLVEGNKAILHLYYDGLILDGWSQNMVTEQLDALYRNPEEQVEPLDLSYRDYICAVQELKKLPAYDQAKQYWLERLTDMPGPPDLPLKRQPDDIHQPNPLQLTRKIMSVDWDKFQQKAAGWGVSPQLGLFTAFAHIVGHWSSAQQFTLSAAQFNRLEMHPQVKELAGEFASVWPFSFDLRENKPFIDEVKEMEKRFWRDMDHRLYSGVEALRELSRQRGDTMRSPAPVVFTSLLHLGCDEEEEQVRSFQPSYWMSQTSQVWIDAIVSSRNGELHLIWDCVEELFELDVLDTMLDAYCKMIQQLASNRAAWQQTHWELTPERELAILDKVNETDVIWPDKSLMGVLMDNRRKYASKAAIQTQSLSLSYEELFRKAETIAAFLRNSGVTEGDCVAIMMEKGWEQIVGIVATLACGAVYIPLPVDWPATRLTHVLEESAVQVVLTQSWLIQFVAPFGCTTIAVDEVVTRDSDKQDDIARTRIEELPGYHKRTGLAFILFTSGSTGRPKGVMLEHPGLMNVIYHLNHSQQVNSLDSALALTHLHHDFSVYDTLGMLAAGGTIVLPDHDKARDPGHWLDLLVQHEVTIWSSVPAFMEMFTLYKQGKKQRSLPSLRLFMAGGDWIPLGLPATLRSLAPHAQFVSIGGPTETTFMNISYPVDAICPTWKSIPYGKPIANAKYYILNDRLERCPIGITGIMYCEGTGLAKGYLNDPETTSQSFIIHPKSGNRLYRTGDLGRYLQDGNIEFRGRADTQVKLRGQRIELGEIEYTLSQYPGIQKAVATVWEEQQTLAAYYIAEAEIETSRLQSYLRDRLPIPSMPAFFIRLEEIPLSANGKIDRKSLPIQKPEFDKTKVDGNVIDENRSDVLTQVKSVFAEILDIERIEDDDHLFTLGGNSLLAIRIAHKIEETTGLSVPLSTLFLSTSIAEFVEMLKSHRSHADADATIPNSDGPQRILSGSKDSQEEEIAVPLTHAQEGIWLAEQLKTSDHYLLTASMRILGPLSRDLFHKALNAVVERQSILRTRIRMKGNEPVQVVCPPGEVEVEWVDLCHDSIQEETIQQLQAEFATEKISLDNWRLYRFRLVTIEEQCHLFLFGFHHIIADEASFGIFVQDLLDAYKYYAGEVDVPPNALPLEYIDYAAWLHSPELTERYRKEVDYWRSKLAEPPVPIRLPYRSEPDHSLEPGAYYWLPLEPSLLLQFEQLCQTNRISLFSGWLALFSILLFRLSGQSDIVVGTPVSTRNWRQVEGMMGMFVNMLPIRLSLHPDWNFEELLTQINETVTETLTHRLLPFEKVAKEISSDPTFIRLPLQVTFNFIDSNRLEQNAGPLEFKSWEYVKSSVAHQFGLFIEKEDDQTRIAFSYKQTLFEKTSISRIADYFKQLVESTLREPNFPLLHNKSYKERNIDMAETFRF